MILRDVEQHFLDRAVENISKNLDREIKKGKIAEGEKAAILSRIDAVTDLAAIARADFAIEAVPEQLELKRRSWRKRIGCCARRPFSPRIRLRSP